MNEITILKKIIEIPSQIGINPEKELANYLKELLIKYNFKISEYEFAKNRPNIVATYAFKKKGPTIVFNGHMDTMPYYNGENSWDYSPEKATEVDGKIYGRGACDMKGGIACALSAVFKCIEEDKGAGTIVINLVCDEENTSLYGTVPLCERNLIHGDIAIVMEPTECIACPKQLGNMFFKSFIKGDGGHTGLPKGKINCFDLAYKYINILKEWIVSKRIHRNDEQPFINIGNFTGGTGSGTIPTECCLYWGTRVMPEDNFDDYKEEIIEITNKFNKTLPDGCYIETNLFEGGGIDSFSSDSKYIDKLIKLTNKKAGIFPASSDAGFLANMLGINSVIYGPGSLKQAHKSNEFVSISDLNECAYKLYKFIASIGEENE